jgi:hypothetical protein
MVFFTGPLPVSRRASTHGPGNLPGNAKGKTMLGTGPRAEEKALHRSADIYTST